MSYAVADHPVKPLTLVLSPDAFDQMQSLTGPGVKTADPKGKTGPTRVLSPDEFDAAQSMTGPAVKAMQIPALPPIPAAPRDALRGAFDKQPKGKTLAPFEIKDPTTYANPVLRQIVNPALDNPLTTVATAAALPVPGLGQIVGGVMGGTMALDIARYGYQKYLETHATPDARKEMESDPERVSGEAAAVQAGMLGLGSLIHVGLKASKGLDFGAGMFDARGLEADGGQVGITENAHAATSDFAQSLEDGSATDRVPHDVTKPPGFAPTATGARVSGTPRKVPGFEEPTSATPGKVKPVETLPANASLEERAAYDQSVREYQAERAKQDEADLSASRTADAEKIAKADAMRPRRRPAAFFESEQGANVLGTMAGRHGLPDEASPYVPATSLDAAWKAGHAAATESFPEGFSMGGALTDNRIPGAGEIPPTASASKVEGWQLPTTTTPESVALANALKPSPFRGHTTDALAEAALDAQAELERANAAIAHSATREHSVWNDIEATPETVLYEDRGREATDVPAAVHEKAAARAKAKLAQIEREFAMRGVSGDQLADVMAAAKETRLEREGMSEDNSLAAHISASDPFGGETAPVTEPVAAESGSAQPLVEGTGPTRTRGLAAGVEAKAVANKLTTTLGDLPEYKQLSMADQAVRATELLARDPALARRVALGDAPAPDGLLPESVFTAVENRAIEQGDVATIRDLATGKLTSDATTMGQRIRALAERDPESPVGAIKRIVDLREGGANKVPRATEETVASLRKQLAGVEVKQAEWSHFIEALRC